MAALTTSRMAAEIAAEPEVVEATLAALLPLRPEVRALAAGRRVVLYGRGTSDNAATYGRYLLEAHAGVPAALGAPSVATHYRAAVDLSDAVVVTVSQSGSTHELVDVQAWARERGARTVAVTNVAGSPLADGADLALVTRAGEELAVPATKTYVAQLAAVAVIATAVAPDPEALDGPLRRAGDEIRGLLAARAGVEEIGRHLREARELLVSGRGLVLGTALEVALKMEETCLRPVRAYSYADLRHGPISVVDGGVTAILVAAGDGPLLAGTTDLARDLRARGASVVGIGGDGAFAAACTAHVPGPALPEPVAPLGLVVPAQLAVEETARALGLDPDAPRGLTKVTQTD